MILTFQEQFVQLIFDGTKIHTIREDKYDRWKPGNKIHFWKGNPRHPHLKPFRFMEGVCAGVQKIEIRYWKYCDYPTITIDNKTFTHLSDDDYAVMEQLAKNDGFTNIERFCNWFDRDFTGKIIHWTDLRY